MNESDLREEIRGLDFVRLRDEMEDGQDMSDEDRRLLDLRDVLQGLI